MRFNITNKEGYIFHIFLTNLKLKTAPPPSVIKKNDNSNKKLYENIQIIKIIRE